MSAAVAAGIVFTLGTASDPSAARRPPASLVAAGARGGALALGASGAPVAAYVRGRTLYLARLRASGWRAERVAVLAGARDYRLQLVLATTGRPTVLVQDGAGRWLGVARTGRDGWSWRVLVHTPRGSSLGPAGLTLDRALRPVIATAAGTPGLQSRLRLIRLDRDRVSTTTITRGGFPLSVEAPAAMPVLLPGRTVHVVEAFGAEHDVQGVEWGLERDGWWGESLGIGVYDRALGPVRALVDGGGTLWSAWTAAGFAKTLVVLAERRGDASRSTVYAGATLAALALGPAGPEMALNARGGGRIVEAGRGGMAVSGMIADFAVDALGRRHVLVVRDGSLYYLVAPPGRAAV